MSFEGAAPNVERPEDRVKRKWEAEDKTNELSELLAEADSISKVFQVLNTNAVEGMVCGEADGMLQCASMDRLKPILDSWTYLEGTGDEEAARRLEGAATLLEEFPGDALRRQLDGLVRSQLGF